MVYIFDFLWYNIFIMIEQIGQTNQDQQIHDLKIEIALLSLNPDAVHNFDSEYDRSRHIDSLKERLTEYGIDGDEYQAEVVAQNMKQKIKAPVHNVVAVDFSNKAS